MGRKKERVLEVRHQQARKTHKLSDGTYREYAYDQYFISTYIHVPKGWVEDGVRAYRLIAIDEARSFLLIPTNFSRSDIIEIRKALKRLMKEAGERES